MIGRTRPNSQTNKNHWTLILAMKNVSSFAIQTLIHSTNILYKDHFDYTLISFKEQLVKRNFFND